jgi:hypothetical protein
MKHAFTFPNPSNELRSGLYHKRRAPIESWRIISQTESFSCCRFNLPDAAEPLSADWGQNFENTLELLVHDSSYLKLAAIRSPEARLIRGISLLIRKALMLARANDQKDSLREFF